MKPINVLIIDDNKGDAFLINILLSDLSTKFNINVASSLADGIIYLKTNKTDIILLDLSLPDASGMEGFNQISLLFPFIPVIILTGMNDKELAEELVGKGAQNYLEKIDINTKLLFNSILFAIRRNQSELQYQGLFNSIPNGVILINPDLSFIVNKTFLEQFGYTSEEIQKKTIFDFIPDEEKQKQKERIFDGINGLVIPNIYEAQGLRKDGTTFPIEINPKIIELNNSIALLGVISDITVRRKLEIEIEKSRKEIADASKMNAIGRLAGGIAHEFNNMLNAIIGYSKYLMGAFDNNSEYYEDVKEIYHISKNAASLVSDLLSFSRKREVKLEVIDIMVSIQNIINMVKRSLPSGITLEYDDTFRENLLTIKIDIMHFEQIVINLIMNAADSMEDGGVIRISGKLLTIDNMIDNGFKSDELISNDYVQLSICDTGSGIPDDVLDVIFEPFFTTKEVGKGTGLGLAIVYSMVKQHYGLIRVISDLNKGTCFHLFFPSAYKV
ncbi:MAG: ATP-binding protein [Candidatus Heimdallarchaeota archaeon]|nr:ATP-binding protein [Candidatus Heimdallarchaeota archaeon]MDH5644705.1 ATP-binding protein [Candidatus Heimdallarchaeota archaeon]